MQKYTINKTNYTTTEPVYLFNSWNLTSAEDTVDSGLNAALSIETMLWHEIWSCKTK